MPKLTTKTPGKRERFADIALWARANGIVLSYLKVGDVEAQLTDPAAMGKSIEKPDINTLASEYGSPELAGALLAVDDCGDE